MTGWYTRSVFFVTDMDAAKNFYIDSLGFTEAWRYEASGNLTVLQVNRGDCEIILTIDVGRAGKSRVFIALEAHELETLQEELHTKAVESTKGWWGYPTIDLRDPDGNELLFPLEE